MPNVNFILKLLTKAAREQGKCPTVLTTPLGNVCVKDYISNEAIMMIDTHVRLMA